MADHENIPSIIIVNHTDEALSELVRQLESRLRPNILTTSRNSLDTIYAAYTQGVILYCTTPTDPTPEFMSDVPVIVLADEPSVNNVVDWMRAGARGVVDWHDVERVAELTAQEQMLAATTPLERTYQDIVDHQTAFICRYDADLRLLFVNQAYCEWQGRTADQLIGTSILHKIPQDSHEHVLSHVRSLTPDNPIAVSVHTSILPDGRECLVEWTDRAIFNEDERLVEYQGVGQDITEQERHKRRFEAAHTELTTFRQHLDSILDTMQDALLSVALPERQVILASPFFYEIYGYSPEQFMADPEFFEQVIHPDDLAGVLEAQATCIREGFVEYEHRIIQPSGEVRWVHHRAWVNYDAAGQPVRINDSGRDITAQKLAQQQLAESEALYRITLSNISDAVFITDDDGRLTFVCPNVRTLFGQTKAQVEALGHISSLLGEPLFDLNELRQVGEIQNIERRVKNKDGLAYDLWITVKHVDIFGGTVLYACRDVTEQKQANLALRASQARFKALVDSQTTYMVRTDLEGYHVYVNDKFEQEYGYLYTENSTMRGHALLSICEYHHQRTREAVEQCVSHPNTVFQVELDKPLQDGSIRTTLWDFVCLTDDSGTPNEIQCIGIDITERVRTEQVLKDSEKRYRAMFEDVEVPKLITDPESLRILSANSAAVRYYGYAPDKLTTMTLYQLIQATEAKIDEKMSKVISGQVSSCVVVHRLADGTLRDIEMYHGLIDFEDKPALYSVFIDVTARNQAERQLAAVNATLEQRVKARTEELKQAKERLEVILDNSADTIVLLSTREGIRQVNRNGQVNFQVDASRDKNRTLAELFHPDAAGNIEAAITHVILSHEVMRIEATAQRADGTTFVAEVSLSPVNSAEAVVTNLVCIIRDVTERKRIEQTIAEERNLLRTVIDAVPDFIYVKDRDHRMILNNDSHARSVGYDNPLDVVGKTDHELFPSALAAKYKADEQRLLQTGRPVVNVEEKSLGVDGTEIWALTTKVPLYNVNGELVGLVGITHDVTDIKAKEAALLQSEQRLRESEHMLQLVLDAIPVRVFWKDNDSVYLGCNRLFAEDAGLANTRDIIGKHDQDLPWSTEEAQAFTADDRQIIESGTPKLDYEESITNSQGETYTLQTNKIPLRSVDGTIIGLLGTYIDVTAQKNNLEQLQYLARLQAQMQDAVVGLDLSYHIKSWNAAAERMYGWTAVEALGQRMDKLITTEFLEEETTDSAMQSLLQHGHWQNEVRQYHRDGTPLNVLASIVTNTDEQGQPIGMIGVNHDITERKRAENALKESEKRFRLLAENVTDMISRHTPDGIYTYATPSSILVTGYSPEELVGHSAYAFFHPDDILSIQESHASIVDMPIVYTVGYRLRQKDGSYCWVETTSHTIRDEEQGEIIEIVAATRDITERKQKENELRESEERFRVMANSVSDIITRLTPDMVPTYASPSLSNILGFQPEALIGKPMLDFIHPDDTEQALKNIATAKQVPGTHKMLFRHQHKDGRYPWLETSFQFLFDPETDAPVEIIATTRDVTDRIEAEQQLQALSQRLQLATRAGGIGIWDWNMQDGSLYWDERMHEIYEMPEETRTRALSDWERHVHPDDLPSTQAAINAAVEDDVTFEQEFRIVPQGGGERLIRANALVVRQPDGTAQRMVGVNMDVTDIKQAEIALQQALQREKELNELKSRFVSTASHQFRTPLAAILANTETLTEYRERMNPDQIEMRLDRIRKQVGHMQGLIEDVLNLSRIQANDVRYNPTQTDLDGLCREVIDTFDQQAQYHGRIGYTVSRSPLYLLLDVSLMHHVLNNLIHNALKYSSEDQPVTVDITHDNDMVTVTVQDHGIGIPEADQAAIFEPFHRATNVEAIVGTGLGLSIVQQAVRLHQGEIDVTSSPDAGATFTITLPLSIESE